MISLSFETRFSRSTNYLLPTLKLVEINLGQLHLIDDTVL